MYKVNLWFLRAIDCNMKHSLPHMQHGMFKHTCTLTIYTLLPHHLFPSLSPSLPPSLLPSPSLSSLLPPSLPPSLDSSLYLGLSDPQLVQTYPKLRHKRQHLVLNLVRVQYNGGHKVQEDMVAVSSDAL